MALPVRWFTPIEGSPSPVPMRVAVGSVGSGGTKFWKMLLVAAGGVGYYLSFTHELPTGATIVATAALFLIPGLAGRALGRNA